MVWRASEVCEEVRTRELSAGRRAAYGQEVPQGVERRAPVPAIVAWHSSPLGDHALPPIRGGLCVQGFMHVIRQAAHDVGGPHHGGAIKYASHGPSTD